jgi:outer membrane immunogenic protein
MEIGRTGVIALAVLVSTAVASIPAAADGGPNGAYADRDYYPSIWSGLYAGVHVGFGDGDGVLGGGQVGYNWQSGRVVYGIEADFAASSIEEGVSGCISSSMGSRICAHASASLDWLATVRGRIGYLIDPRILAYATAGVGIASWSAEAGISGCNLPECPEIKLRGRETDFVFGLGVEGKISETMSARVDFLSGGDLDADVVRAGLNFKFGQ